jgi:hypothetical protein
VATKLTTEQFIEKAIEVHGDRYDYSLVEYKSAHTKVKIICKEHGTFEQAPTNHLVGNGCSVCSYVAKASIAKSEFADKANLVHSNKYSYELVDYKNSHAKVSIVCPIHGEFEQSPSNHIRGRGCNLCANLDSGFNRTSFVSKCDKNNNGLGILYILECFNDTEKFYKIGITSTSIKRRYNSSTKMPYLYSIVKEIIGDPVEIYNLETKLHQLNKENQYIPSIQFCGYATECFKEYKEII